MTQQYGSVVNMAMDDSAQPVPEVGMGCTILYWSDRVACTIESIGYFKTGFQAGSPSVIIAREDFYTRTDNNGISENQDYEYHPDPNGKIFEIRKNVNGSWRVKGTNMGVLINHRRKYVDYSF